MEVKMDTTITIKIGSTEEFFNKIRCIMKDLDEGKIPKSSSRTITFEDPVEAFNFKNEKRYLTP